MSRAAAFVLLTLCACSSLYSPANTAAGFTVVQQHEPRSLNPALENGQAATQWGFLLFSYLVKYDDRGHLIGDAAVEAPTLANHGISADGRTIVYHLRRGIRFADGVPLTAKDCVWTIDAIKNAANNVQSRYGYDRIVSAYAPDAYTLVLHLQAPFAPLLTLILAPQTFPILPAHMLQKYPNFNTVGFNRHPIGSGPYTVVRWVPGDRVELRANPYYFAGRAKIENLTVRFVPDAQTAVTLLQTHEVQGYFDSQDYSQYPILESLRGYRVTRTQLAGIGSLIFNTSDPRLSDPRIRHALAEAIDVRSLVRKAYRDAVSPDDAGRGLFLWAFDARAYPDVPYNPATARTVLAGRGLDLNLILRSGSTADAVMANAIAQYERAVGVHVNIKSYAISEFAAPANEGGPVYGGRFQLALYTFINGDDPDTTDQFACKNVPPNGFNKSRICNPQIDALLRQGAITFDTAKRKAIYAKLERLLYQQLPMLILFNGNQINTFTDRLNGQTTSIDGAWWNVSKWSLR